MSFGGLEIEGIEVVLEAPPKAKVSIEDVVERFPQVLESSSSTFGSVLSGASTSTTKPATTKKATADRTLLSDRTLFTSARLSAALQQPAHRDSLNTALKNLWSAQLSSRLPGGFGLHSRTNHQLGSGATARAELVGNRITITAALARNRYFAQITTPGGPLTTNRTDPNFHVFYDLGVRATFLVPETSGGTLVHESAVVSVTNITEPRSKNLISKAAFAANDVVNSLRKFGDLGLAVELLVGPDVMEQVRSDRHVKFGSLISVDLDGINAALGGIAPNLRLERSVKNKVLVLLATSRPAPQGPDVR